MSLTTHSLSKNSFILYAKGVISKDSFKEIERSIVLNGSPLRALSSTVFDDPIHIRIFANVFLQSEETVHVGQDILK